MSCVVVGTGSIGFRHLSLIRQRGDVSVMAFPVRPERRRELIDLGFDVVNDWNMVSQRGATHAVIATNTSRHASDVEAALAAGCHVLVEKPVAADLASARAIAAAAAARTKGLWVGCCLRFEAAMQQFREWLPAVGRLHSVRIESQSYLPDWRPERPFRDSYSARTEEGGVLRDLIHEIDYAGWLFGWPRALQATVTNGGLLGIAADEAADLFWVTSEGVSVSVRLDYLSRPPRRRMVAAGERGVLEWDAVRGSATLALAGRSQQTASVGEPRDAMYLRQADAFLSATPADFDRRLATADDGLRALAVCDAAWRASRSRREETVTYS